MGAQNLTATQPAQLVRAPTGGVLYYRLAVPAAGAVTLVSLLTGGVLPNIPVANVTGYAGIRYVFKGVVLQSEIDPGTQQVRYTADGQTVPSGTLGFVVPGQPSEVTIMCDPQDIKIIATANTNVQCYLIIGGVSDGVN
jgi:hypothetical protein